MELDIIEDNSEDDQDLDNIFIVKEKPKRSDTK